MMGASAADTIVMELLLTGTMLRLSAWWYDLRRRSAPSDDAGQTLAEYGLILAVIATVVMATALFVFREAVGAGFDAVADCIGVC